MPIQRSLLKGLLIGTALLAAGCADEGDDLVAFCTPLGNAVTISASCATNCAVADEALAVDEDLATRATITPDAGAAVETAVLRATGVPVAAGATAGVWVAQPRNLASTENTLRTYLGNVLQESSDTAETVVVVGSVGTRASAYLGMVTTLPFDAVEFTTRNTFEPGQTPLYRVYEVCGDGGAV